MTLVRSRILQRRSQKCQSAEGLNRSLLFPSPVALPLLSFSLFSSLRLSLFLEIGFSKIQLRVWESAVSSCSGVAEPQRKSNLVHFSFNLCNLAATVFIIVLKNKVTKLANLVQFKLMLMFCLEDWGTGPSVPLVYSTGSLRVLQKIVC